MLVAPPVAIALGAVLGMSSVPVRVLAMGWTFAYAHSFFSRARCMDVATRWLGLGISRRALALLPAFLFIDYLAWTIPLGQYPFRALRDRW
jgi:hypothetical protein